MRARLLALLSIVACVPDDVPFPAAAADAEADPVRFGFPLADPSAFSQVIGVDHDPETFTGPLGAAQCTAYDGSPFPSCYDGHDGTDYLLDGGFDAMDAGSVEVIAAAAGTVVSIEEAQYDRCHLEGTEVSCDGHPIVGNHVKLDHGDGVETWYWHLMTDSVFVEVGDEVACGEVLALVGSSGLSSLPHLHFELRVEGDAVDPYAGEASQPESFWDDQGAPDELPGPGCTRG